MFSDPGAWAGEANELETLASLRMVSLTPMPGSSEGGVFEFDGSSQSVHTLFLISRLLLIIGPEALACLLLFFMVMKLLINLSTLNYSRLLVLGSFSPVE